MLSGGCCRRHRCDCGQCCSHTGVLSLPAPTLLSATVPCGGLSRMALETASQRSSSCAPPCMRKNLLPCNLDVLLVITASHARRELVRAVGLHPLPGWSHCTEAGSKKYINLLGQRNGVWPTACVISSSGRTSRPGDPRSNPHSAVSLRAVRLAVHKGEVPPTAPYGAKLARSGTPGCHAVPEV